MLKTYTFQSVDRIIDVTGGNKAKIRNLAETMQAPLQLCVLAGMKVDTIRNAAQAEQQPQQTVAEQVLGTAPPAPPQGAPPQGAPPQGAPPQGAPAGLGATPEAAQMGQMMPPQGGAPMSPQSPEQMQPMNMAEGGLVAFGGGGLSDLPVPDTMFDENRNGGFDDGYAGGGIVAFARGGASEEDDYAAMVERLYPYIEQVESGGRPRPGPMTKYGQAQGIAQMLPDTARGAAGKLGVPYDPDMLAGKTPEDIEYQRKLAKAYLREGAKRYRGDPAKTAMFYHGGPDTEIWGPKTRGYRDKVMGLMGDAPADVGVNQRLTSTDPTYVPQAASLADLMQQFSTIIGPRPTKAQKERLAAMMGTPEKEEKAKDRDLGFAFLAASRAFGKPGPFGSQLGEAFANMGEPLREGEKAREARKLNALNAAADAENQDYADKLAMMGPAAGIYKAGLDTREAALGRSQRASEFKATEERTVAEAALDRTSAETRTFMAKNPSDQEGAIAAIKRDNPGMSDSAALAAYLMLKQQYAPAAIQPTYPGGPPAQTAISGGLDLSQWGQPSLVGQ